MLDQHCWSRVLVSMSDIDGYVVPSEKKKEGRVEMLRWLRENGCPWIAHTRDQAAAKLGYLFLDDFFDK